MSYYVQDHLTLKLFDHGAILMLPRGKDSRGLTPVNHSLVISLKGESVSWLQEEWGRETCIIETLGQQGVKLSLKDEAALTAFIRHNAFFAMNTDHQDLMGKIEAWGPMDLWEESHFEQVKSWMTTPGVAWKAHRPRRINILGLGDVGSTMALALQAYGQGKVDEIGIYDLEDQRIQRWEIELNQIALPLENALPRIVPLTQDTLFDCDIFAFTASVGVPPVSVTQGDVRVVQFKGNSQLVELYMHKAMEASFEGIFAIVSDPVDHLCRFAYECSQRIAADHPQWKAFAPERIRGYGLGVMNGRAAYFSQQRGLSYDHGRVYGPHGDGLVVCNDYRAGQWDEVMSEELTYDTITANLKMRSLGYKPYIAPAVASGAISLARTLSGEWHYSCVPFSGIYYGCLNRRMGAFDEHEQLPLEARLQERIHESFMLMEAQWEKL